MTIPILTASIVAQDVIAKNADDGITRKRELVKNANQKKKKIARTKLVLDKT